MALARWARSEDPKPYTLYTRRGVDEWILPHIDKTDTLFSVLERYFIFLTIHIVEHNIFNCFLLMI